MALGDLDLSLKPQKLELFLARPNMKIIAKLTEAYSKSHTVKLGNINELTFSVPYEIDINHKLKRNPNVDLLKDRYLIKAKIGKEEDWYIITSIQESMDDDKDEKVVTAMLLPYEMTAKLIRSFSYTSLNLSTTLAGGKTLDVESGEMVEVDGILSTTKWKLGYVDASFDVKYRSIDFSSVTILDAILQVAETFNALIIWDTNNRTLSFYDPELYGINRGLTLNYGHYLKSLSRESQGDEFATRLKVFGKDGLSIQSVNLTGQNYIEDYSFFLYPFQRDEERNVLSHSDYMSDDLCHAILDYTEFVQSKEGVFSGMLEQREQYETQILEKESQKTLLYGELDVILDELDSVNYQNGDTTDVLNRKIAKEQEIANKETEIDDLETLLSELNVSIQELRVSLAYSNFFTPELMLELNDFVIEKEYTNDSIDIAQDLYDEALEEFEDVKTPQVSITIDIVNFLEIVEAQRDWDKLVMGDIVTIRYEKMNINMTAKIIEYTINHEDGDISITIANTKDILTDEEKLIQMLYSSSVASTTLDMNKFKWDGIDHTASQVENIINNTWDANKRAIEAGINNSIEIGARGLIIRDQNDPMSYLVAQNGILAITNDNGNSWKNAITKDGIIGERLFGKIIAGVNLIIDASDASGSKTFTVDSNGVTIAGSALRITGGLPTSELDPSFKDSLVNLNTPYNGVVIDTENGLVITKSNNTIRTILNATEGFSFEKNEGGTWNKMLFYEASSGNLNITGEINAKALKVNGVNVLTDDDKLSVDAIETLEVGKNVAMGSGAYISWSNVNNKPWIPSSATEIGAIPSTYIDSQGIWTGKINANSIVAGKITADYIDATNLTASKIFHPSRPDDSYMTVGGSFGDLVLYWSGYEWFRIYNNIGGVSLKYQGTTFLSSGGASTSAKGTWDFSDATVTGLSVKAVFS